MIVSEHQRPSRRKKEAAMPSGGHARSGPPPDPTSLRSGAAGASGGWTRMTTPPDTPPAWPLGTPTDAEAAVWADLWTRPASSLWERFGLVRDAATYVRTVLAFEAGGHGNAALGGLVQRMADQLGLTVAGAARNRWTWPTATATSASVTPIRHTSSRDRFRRIPPGTARDFDPATNSSEGSLPA
jgi:hypothetical protein